MSIPDPTWTPTPIQTSWDDLLSWMNRWLKYDGDPFGAWDARPTPTA